MKLETTNSWIFLAVAMASSESATTINGIIGIADGINHAVPTQKELQNAVGWLLKQELISKEGKKYQLTDKGLVLFKEGDAKSNLVFGTWDFLKESFLTLNSEQTRK